MNSQEILHELQSIFDDLFLDPVKLDRGLTAASVEEWDSLQHISIIVAVEKRFGIRFNTGEVVDLKNVGEFVDLLETKLKAGAC